MKRRILIVGSSSKPGVKKQMVRFGKLLRGKAHVLTIDLDKRTALAGLAADLGLIFGGDGTILAFARRLGGTPLACLGVNMGKLGFLAAMNIDEVRDALDWIAGGDLTVGPRLMLEVPIGHRKKMLALNDVVISSPRSCRMITVDLRVDGELLNSYFGDGLIVSTPVGSTAYSLSAGGPLVSPRLAAILITPICPHHLSSRPIIVPSSSRIEIRADCRPARLTFDGQDVVNVGAGEWITISRAKHDFLLVEPDGHSFFRTLEKKMDWGRAAARGRS